MYVVYFHKTKSSVVIYTVSLSYIDKWNKYRFLPVWFKSWKLFGQYKYPLPGNWSITLITLITDTLTEQPWQFLWWRWRAWRTSSGVCFLSPGEYFILIILPSEVWRGLDKMQAEQPESYSRMLEESVQWQNKANSLPEPCKVNHDLIITAIILRRS